MKDRELWGDIARGICIILVIIRHIDVYTDVTNVITWFVIPAFFIISGYFFKPLENKAALVSWLKKRAGRLLIPYFTFLMLLSLLVIVLQSMHVSLATTSEFNLANIILGGSTLPGIMLHLWFIPVLFMTQGVFALLIYKLKTPMKCLIPIAIAYIVAHIESWLVFDQSYPIYVPFGADLVLLSLSFCAFGFYAKSIIGTPKRSTLLVSGAFIAAMITLNMLGVFEYTLSMIALQYTNPVLDIVMPVVMTLFVIQCSHIVVNMSRAKDLFVIIGKNSLVIYILSRVVYGSFIVLLTMLFKSDISTSIYIIIVGILLAIIIPLIVGVSIINRYKITRILFAGQYEGLKAKKSEQ